VREVAPGSPAERCGIRAGDRVVRADGAELSQLDQWSARVAAARAGEELALTIDRDGGLLDVTVLVGAREQAVLQAARRFLEGRKARCVVETDWSELDGERRPVARVVELAESSPLLRAGIAPGAALCTLDGERLGGAADFARRVSRMPFGATIDLEWVDERGRHAAELELHRPERHFTAIRFWPLFGWEETPDESKGEWYLLDLWLIWLVRYGHEGEASELSILRFIRFETGAGALVEEPAFGAAPGASSGARR
jgi:membrane-associated protease RseP (regulator of RpoE activity)